MSLLSLIFCYFREKPFATLFQVIFMAFGTAIITAFLLFGHHIDKTFYKNSDGIDAVIGAKGSPLQLVLSSLYQMDIPTGNISLAEANKIKKHRDIKKAIPIALGDNYRGHHIIGTDASYLKHYNAEFASGGIWNASLQTVLGHDLAKRLHLDIGDYFIAAHGLMADGHAHDNMPYQVVGILQKNHSKIDNLILTSLESVWDMHHSESKDITALLVSYKNRHAAFSFPRIVNNQTSLMAASPAMEMARLSKMIGIGEKTIIAFGSAFILFAMLAIAMSMAQNITHRQYDLAIFRSLGASAQKIFMLTLFEAALIILIGQMIGLLLGHSIIHFCQLDNMSMTGFIFVGKIWIINGIIFMISLLTCMIPAFKAYNLDIAVLLRND